MLLAGWNITFLAERGPPCDEQTRVVFHLHSCSVSTCVWSFFFFCLLSPNICCWEGFACRGSWHSLTRTRLLNEGWGIWLYGGKKAQVWDDLMITEHNWTAFICREDMFHHIYLVAEPSASDACNPSCPFSQNYPPIPVLLTKGRAWTLSLGDKVEGKHEESRLSVGRWAGFVSDLSDWKLMEAVVLVWADVCFRCPGPLRCDAFHPIWKPRLSVHEISSCIGERHYLFLTEVWQKHLTFEWLQSMKRKRDNSHVGK